MRVKIEIKNNLGKFFFNGGLNWKKKLKKIIKIKRMMIKLKKNQHKLGLNDEIENHQNFYKKLKKKN
jgi:hypothetical protein